MTKNHILCSDRCSLHLRFLLILPIFLLLVNLSFANEIDDCEDFFREYYEDTNSIEDEGCLKDGEFDGPYKSYYLDGSPWESLTYDKGKLLDQDGEPFRIFIFYRTIKFK